MALERWDAPIPTARCCMRLISWRKQDEAEQAEAMWAEHLMITDKGVVFNKFDEDNPAPAEDKSSDCGDAAEVSTSARTVSNREEPVKLGPTAPSPSHKLQVVPLDLKTANVLVKKWHRHNGVLRGGAYFCIGLADETLIVDHAEDFVMSPRGHMIVGAVIVGPVSARGLTTPYACEVKRLVTDGTVNACSMLYGAAWRAAKSLGFEGMITYTLKTEEGASLRASNWRLDEDHVPVRVWKSRAPEFAHLRWSERPTTQNSPALARQRWFIGRRVPSQSSVRYSDDPANMGTNPNLDKPEPEPAEGLDG